MDSEQFKAGLSRFGAGVTIITTWEAGGEPAGFTATSFSSVSIEPPLVLFCLEKEATCCTAFAANPEFGVNILTYGQQELSNRFASRSEDKFAGVPLKDGPDGPPLIEGCLVNLACRTVQTLPGGDHLIFVGEVRAVHLGEGAPLFYFMGKYHPL